MSITFTKIDRPTMRGEEAEVGNRKAFVVCTDERTDQWACFCYQDGKAMDAHSARGRSSDECFRMARVFLGGGEVTAAPNPFAKARLARRK